MFIEHILSYVGVNQYLVEIVSEGEFARSNIAYFFDKGYEGVVFTPDGEHRFAKKHSIIKNNIVPLMKTYKVPVEFDCLSLDMNGNDYWILTEILKNYKPSLIVCEFNCSRDACETIQYNENHKWQNDDYFGFSFSAGKQLAEKFGYNVVFQNDDLNLYMVRKELIEGDFQPCNYQKNYWFPHNSSGIWERV